MIFLIFESLLAKPYFFFNVSDWETINTETEIECPYSDARPWASFFGGLIFLFSLAGDPLVLSLPS